MNKLIPLLMLCFASCLGPSSGTPLPPDTSATDPKNTAGKLAAQTDGLLYNGSGVSTSDWQATLATGDPMPAYGFAIAPGPVLSVYWPGGNSSLTAAMVRVALWSGTTRQLIWWGGPSACSERKPLALVQCLKPLHLAMAELILELADLMDFFGCVLGIHGRDLTIEGCDLCF